MMFCLDVSSDVLPKAQLSLWGKSHGDDVLSLSLSHYVVNGVV